MFAPKTDPVDGVELELLLDELLLELEELSLLLLFELPGVGVAVASTVVGVGVGVGDPPVVTSQVPPPSHSIQIFNPFVRPSPSGQSIVVGVGVGVLVTVGVIVQVGVGVLVAVGVGVLVGVGTLHGPCERLN